MQPPMPTLRSPCPIARDISQPQNGQSYMARGGVTPNPQLNKTVAPCDRRIVPEACYTDSAHVATGSTEPPPGCMNQTAVDFSVVLNRPAGRASRLCLCTLMEKRLTHGGLRYVRQRTERLAQEEDHERLRLRSPGHWARPRIGANVLRRQYDGSLHASVFHTCGPIWII